MAGHFKLKGLRRPKLKNVEFLVYGKFYRFDRVVVLILFLWKELEVGVEFGYSTSKLMCTPLSRLKELASHPVFLLLLSSFKKHITSEFVKTFLQ